MLPKQDEQINIFLALYRKMLMARKFEEKVAQLYIQGYISGFCHLYIGQEAVVVGISSNITPQDSVITSYRDHAHMLILGVEPKFVMAELCGKITGCSRGKGGSMHMYSKEHNFYGGNGIVGAQVPIGAGLAFAHKYKKDSGVSIVYFGDGAANQGQVYESFNMTMLWNLPVVYVLENNRYAMGTAVDRSSGNNLKNRGDSFGIPTILVDGMDLFDVMEKSKEAIDYVRANKGPIIMHVDTYRYKGHSMSDPGTYRTREEIDNIKKTRDPIIQCKQRLIEEYNINQQELENISNEISELIEDIAKFAIESPFPDGKCLTEDIIL
ncbi:MAG: pyruvate dehydrogenase (acetyl-transferring) E1 component subunit alpha [Holosporales bacterium]|jgi:pyruvate dehydrogenase E1 component alpha subunit|nr:pyruvate dehydrogenase (acetyl-transferring) E1 component subunit alpha [Holosporales bacterium]